MRDTSLSARLDALESYGILDTVQEDGFDDIVAIAADICATPVSLVSLVERDRQWFKARVGVDLCETPIEQSVCNHGMGGADLLIIPDLTLDPRTRENTLVTEDPFIRFYAGAPLVTPQGVTIGMLCVIDVEPRPAGLTEGQARSLTALARQVMTQMELRRTLRQLDDSVSRARFAEEAGGIGTFELDVRTNMMTVSPEFCRLFGLPVTATCDAEAPESMIDRSHTELRSSGRTRSDGSAAQTVEYRLAPRDGHPARWLRRSGRFRHDDAGAVTHMYGSVQDITSQRMLNEEIGHRLKNTLTLVQAIATHSLRDVPDRAPVVEFEKRLAALGSAHDALVQRIGAGAPLQAVAEAVLGNLGLRDRTALVGPTVDLGEAATLSFSMLLHELGTNALKYGAFSAPDGHVSAAWRIEGDELVFDWIEAGGPEIAKPSRRGFGSRLIERGLAGTGSAMLDYRPAGLSATFRAPIAAMQG